MTHGESWESQHSNVFVTKYSSGQWILHLFLHIQTRNCIDSTAEPAYCSPNQSHNLGERDGNRSKLHHPRPPAPPRCWLTCATPTHGWWPILAAREHRDRCRGHHDSAALATNFSSDDKGGGGMSLLDRRSRWWPQTSPVHQRDEKTTINQQREHQSQRRAMAGKRALTINNGITTTASNSIQRRAGADEW